MSEHETANDSIEGISGKRKARDGASHDVQQTMAARNAQHLDPSIEMLRVARSHGLLYVVAGTVPSLPFAADTFDRVVGSFVLAHFADYKSALVDMARVLRRGGRL